MNNLDIADLFDEIADLLEIQAETQFANPFRVRAYRNASRVIRTWPVSLVQLVAQEKEMIKMPGIGNDLAGKIIEAVTAKKIGLLEDLRAHTPKGLRELIRLPGIGPKRVRLMRAALGVSSIEDLERILTSGDFKNVRGFGPKLEEMLRTAVKNHSPAQERKRVLLADASLRAQSLLDYLGACPGVTRAVIAGSFRRSCETVGDLDILVSCKNSSQVTNYFLGYEDVARVLAKGTTRASIVLRSGLQVDLRVVAEKSYGAALHYFTGSKAHNIAIRTLGLKRGLKINEYGIYRGTKRVGGLKESDVFEAVGLPDIEPELRENRGEIEAAAVGRLPRLVTLSQIRGDLHAHSTATDGHRSIEEMAMAAQALGYEYLAITDHSKRLAMTHGLDSKRLLTQMREIDRLNDRLRPFQILKAIEVDILEDGKLDLPDSILRRLDLTVCSIHSHFHLSREKQTTRILRAIDNPCFHIFGHPTGRLINQRPPMEFDMEKIMRAAKTRGCFLEINAQPERLDLSDVHCRLAHEIGVMVVISTDAHSDHELGFMKFGVSQARRGWLETRNILNTRSWSEIQRLIQRRDSLNYLNP